MWLTSCHHGNLLMRFLHNQRKEIECKPTQMRICNHTHTGKKATATIEDNEWMQIVRTCVWTQA